MDQDFVKSVYSNWARMAPEATFFAITADERDAWVQLGFEVSGGWCTPPLSHAQRMKELLASLQA